MIYTFWEGKMPEYIKLCMETWKFRYVILTYDNLEQYTNLDVEKLKSNNLTLPQIADVVRVHVLRDQGGYWLDTDTIMLDDQLPKENILGYPDIRTATIGFLHTESHSPMFEEWAHYQDQVLDSKDLNIMKVIPFAWDIMGNAFVDPYLLNHPETTIGKLEDKWLETCVIGGTAPRWKKYDIFYFGSSYSIDQIPHTNMIMLHNSWTPPQYKRLCREAVLQGDCTLSNILREVLKNDGLL